MGNDSTYGNKTNSHLNTFNKKKRACDVENPGPGLEQTEKCGEVKLVNGIPSLSSWYLDFQRQYIYQQTFTDSLPL